ncbi:hypothetical protein BGZ99_005014 [Dissophora globulifera]|uniref:DDE-1 domain-containing protein n=1 Tax=Dissophora globulifera TaxID=979702 RepID=A0A9P6RIS8_9FUNG|nr:hypothetical protein BGZ99_005014 [Dissophora globulifera]
MEIATEMYVLSPKGVKEHVRPPSSELTEDWLQRFKFNFNIAMRVIHGDAGRVDVERYKDAFAEIAQRLSHYKPKEIYNCDETGLYLKLFHTDDIKVPNAALCECVADGWDDVTVAKIRNCFAHVPVLPKSMKGELRTEVVLENDKGLEAVKQEIMTLYSDWAEAIAMQKDYGAVMCFQSLQNKGPSPNYLKALELVRNDPEYKGFFIEKKDQASDRNEEDDKNDENPTDCDY